MNKRLIQSFLAATFLLLPTFALADVAADGDNSPTTPQPFTFTCEPYKLPFEEGKHYMIKPVDRADDLATCHYTIPQTGTFKVLAIYKGTVGSSTLISSDSTINTPLSSLRTFPNVFRDAQNEDNYFTVAYSSNVGDELNGADAYFQTGVGSPPADLSIVHWKWGPKPASEFDPVIIIPGILGSWEKDGELILDPLTHTYDNLVDTFLANGYVEGQTLFEFPYNWRNSNIDSAHLLSQKIQAIKTTCSCDKVDIVAHIQTISMKAKFQAETLWNGYLTIFDYIRNKPIQSIQELLPVYTDYLRTDTTALHYPHGYPANFFIENLLNNFSKISEKPIRTKNVVAKLIGNNTVTGFAVASSTEPGKWEHGQPVLTELGFGDGTVPESSYSYELPIDREFLGVDHNGIVSTSSAYVFKALNGSEPETKINKTYHIFNSVLSFVLLSPIDMEIIAPDGKRMGRNIEGSGELNEIPDAFYSGFNTDHEYAIIPNPLPGEYKVKTVGTGNGGHYRIVVNYIDVNGFVESETNGTTTPAEVINNSVTLSTTGRTVQIVKVEAPIPTLEELLAQLKAKIQGLDIKKQLKDNLLKESEKIEKKIE
ncbi:hypothetical protein KW798_01925, partial [Candidatus Parcubacteria bacterium]|nr:hypothetical protein [Candidatus Parcubacteria bacterium]